MARGGRKRPSFWPRGARSRGRASMPSRERKGGPPAPAKCRVSTTKARSATSNRQVQASNRQLTTPKRGSAPERRASSPPQEEKPPLRSATSTRPKKPRAAEPAARSAASQRGFSVTPTRSRSTFTVFGVKSYVKSLTRLRRFVQKDEVLRKPQGSPKATKEASSGPEEPLRESKATPRRKTAPRKTLTHRPWWLW